MDALQHLKSVSTMSDADIDLGVTALAMVADDHEGVSVDRYIQHLKKINRQVAERHFELLSKGADDDAGAQIAALKYVLYDRHGYYEDDTGEPLENADLMRVIDLGRGCSAALCLFYMNAARMQGWDIEGINFPSRYLCRIVKDGQRLIFDPVQQCKLIEAHDLRALLKGTLGDVHELSTEYYKGQDARETIIHLCDYLKLRRIEMGDYAAGIELIERMRLIAPDEYRLLLDAGVLYMRLHEDGLAVRCLEDYIERCENLHDRNEAMLLLQDLAE